LFIDPKDKVVISKYCHVFAFEIERLQATAIKGTDKKNIENLNFQNIINAPKVI
jgi:hypothetical protein